MRAEQISAGWAADDGAALHFVDGTLHRAVSSRPAAHVYRVQCHTGVVEEEKVAPDFLG